MVLLRDYIIFFLTITFRIKFLGKSKLLRIGLSALSSQLFLATYGRLKVTEAYNITVAYNRTHWHFNTLYVGGDNFFVPRILITDFSFVLHVRR
jgi:hypothetical protein